MSKSTSIPIQIPLPLDGATLEIPLTRGYTTVIDTVDADLSEFKWHACGTTHIYATRNLARHHFDSLHRVIAERVIGRKLETHELIDHVDGDGLNNKRENLRLATHAQNSMNLRGHSSSGYKGVTFNKSVGRWQASIKVNGKSIYLGCYSSPEEGHKAYVEAAVKYFGEFARFK